jgi:hypothetical protein
LGEAFRSGLLTFDWGFYKTLTEMENTPAKPVLTDQNVYPDEAILRRVLKEQYGMFEELMHRIISKPFELVPEWNYYKDGKSWLCKVMYKKKTVFWLSVWDACFKVTFYFTAKTETGINDLDIAHSIKTEFQAREAVGKLKPLTILFTPKTNMDDVLLLIRYKKGLK